MATQTRDNPLGQRVVKSEALDALAVRREGLVFNLEYCEQNLQEAINAVIRASQCRVDSAERLRVFDKWIADNRFELPSLAK